MGDKKARVGDQLIIGAPGPGHAGRIGTIVALSGDDGSPAYVVRWLAGYESLVFPGPDVRIEQRRRYPARTVAGAWTRVTAFENGRG